MPKLARQILVWVAVYGIALQAILAPLAPFGAQAGPVDPFAVICHSDAGAADPERQPAPLPVCNHCVLCTVAGAAAIPDVPQIIAAIVPCETISPPVGAAPTIAAVFFSNLARGPPATV